MREIEEIEKRWCGRKGVVLRRPFQHEEDIKILLSHTHTLEERITEQDHINIGLVESLSNALDDLGKSQEKVRELEKESTENLEVWKTQQTHANFLMSSLEVLENKNKQAESRLKRLEEAVDRHKVDMWGYGQDEKGIMYEVGSNIDEELYKIRDQIGKEEI